MKLTFEQIKAITVGAVSVEQQDDGIHFYKCTAEQISYYETVSEQLAKGASGTTGICLDFLTDARQVTVSVNAGGKYEVYVNGMMTGQYVCKEVTSFSFDLPDFEDGNRVTVCLASHGSGGVIREIELTDAEKAERPSYACKMLFLGDSITQGWNSEFDTLSYAYRTARFFDAESMNQGIGGSRFLPETVVPLPFDPDYVFVAFGTNDFDFYKRREDPVGDFHRVVDEYLDRIKALYAGKTVFVISPIPRLMHHEDMLILFREFCKTVGEEAEKKNMIRIDGFTLVPRCIPLFADGYLHPNDNGFSVYAENLIRQILPYVRNNEKRKEE